MPSIEGLERAPPKSESINAIDKGAYTHQDVACCDVSLQATRNMRASARTNGNSSKVPEPRTCHSRLQLIIS